MSRRASLLRRSLAAFIAGVAVFAVLSGGGAAWAMWTASATGTATVTTQRVAITQANFPALGATYYNSELTSTGSFTVQNTGVIAGTVTVSIAASQAQANQFRASIWQLVGAMTCTAGTNLPTTGVTTDTLAAITATTTLAANASANYCMRISLPDRQGASSATGTVTVQPSLVATLSAQGWSAQTTAAIAAFRTVNIYPLDTSRVPTGASRWFELRDVRGGSGALCLDVADFSGQSGTGTVIAYSCYGGANQQWQFIPVNEADPTLVTLRPRHQPGTRLAVTPQNHMIVQGASAAIEQQWYIQRVSATRTQLVSASTGLCLIVGTTSPTQSLTARCDNAGASIETTRQQLTFQSTGTNQGTFMVGGVYAPLPLTAQYRSGQNWVTLPTATGNTDYNTRLIVTTSAISTAGTAVQLLLPNGEVAYSGITLSRSGTVTSMTAGGG